VRQWLRARRPPPPAPPCYADELRALLKLAQEGAYWQGDLEELLVAIRDDGDLGELARAGGPIVSRYEAMRREMRCLRHPRLQPYAAALDEVFANHALLLHSALDLLAVSWRSERLREEQRKLGPIGAQGRRLERLAARLKAMAAEERLAPGLGRKAVT
jgi:hypothetical protein